MARITIEDCLDKVSNRFELVLLATKRARDLLTGKSEPKVAWENDKCTVVALREIAEGLIDESYTNKVPEHFESTEEENTESTKIKIIKEAGDDFK